MLISFDQVKTDLRRFKMVMLLLGITSLLDGLDVLVNGGICPDSVLIHAPYEISL